ncbi:hydrogenase expression protein HypE [Paramagnetospirillum marisnigri]|uniref:Hydrogenase expression protein HypE n=1 Tax=Paramagnetospirillum marisnigri TaxID=1285242 RepID=A0A178MZI6_9PROT|nr:hydrogenase expression protein HypE [Paramagnetospirillum marisnigri]
MGNVSLLDFLSSGHPVEGHRPWPRFRLDIRAWRALVGQLATSEWSVISLWGEPEEIHVALRDDESGQIAIASHPCPERWYVSLGRARPGVIRLERAAFDLWGLAPMGLEDRRPWLDHGRWPSRKPLASQPQPAAERPLTYDFLAAEGEGLHQIPVGPVHAGVIEPGHFRFHCQGEAVVRLEQRLGYVHKGIDGLLTERSVEDAARVAARVSGDATVAYSLAFARAVEAALGCEVPPRAHWLRALMAEMERIANHVFDIGAVCNDAAFAIMLSHMGVLREKILRANDALFGHRLLMDRVVPGGCARDLSEEGAEALKHLLHGFTKDFERAFKLYDNTPSLSDRTQGTGIANGSLVHRFGAGGFVGRASGRGHDSRKAPGYQPYDMLDLSIPVYAEGDVNARLMVRFDEVRESLGLITQILSDMPQGAFRAPLPSLAGEGLAVVESFRGEVMVWVRMDESGRVARAHAHDPSWFQWPLLEAAIEGNIVADFPLCNKSFNCSYSGADL